MSTHSPSFASFSNLEKLANAYSIVLLINAIFLLNIYLHFLCGLNLFSSWGMIKQKVAFGDVIFFFLLFGVYMGYILPHSSAVLAFIVFRLFAWLGIDSILDDGVEDFSKDPNYHSGYAFLNKAIKDNNFTAYSYHKKWQAENESAKNFYTWSLSLVLLSIVDLCLGSSGSIYRHLFSYVHGFLPGLFALFVEVCFGFFIIAAAMQRFTYNPYHRYIYLPGYDCYKQKEPFRRQQQSMIKSQNSNDTQTT